MKIEINISGARRIGKTTLMARLIDTIREYTQDYATPITKQLDSIKVTAFDPPTETLILNTTSIGERYARGVLNAKNNLSEEDFRKEYPL
jgi:hypothetical protein